MLVGLQRARKQINGQFIFKSKDALDASSAPVHHHHHGQRKCVCVCACVRTLILQCTFNREKRDSLHTIVCMCACARARARRQGAQHHSQSTTNTSHPEKRSLAFQHPPFSFLHFVFFYTRIDPSPRTRAWLLNDKCLIGWIRQQRGWSRKEKPRATLRASVHLCARARACSEEAASDVSTTRCLYFKTKNKKQKTKQKQIKARHASKLISAGGGPGLPPHPLNRTPEERPGQAG